MIAIVGGGIAGLTAAIRLAEKGRRVHLFEAAPELGGRTRSFLDKSTGQWCDNGPHLLIGAYHATRNLLDDCQVAKNVCWQKHLNLPLWDHQRGPFNLRPSPWLPLPLGLLLALARLPGHDRHSAMSLLHIAHGQTGAGQTVARWLNDLAVPQILQRDLMQMNSRGVRDELGGFLPALQIGSVGLIEFTRSGWGNSLNLPRSQLQRIAYVLEEETLYRTYWPMLDRSPDALPRIQELLSGVRDIEFTALDSRGEEHQFWPAQSQNDARLAAIAVRLEVEPFGEINRLWLVPTPVETGPGV